MNQAKIILRIVEMAGTGASPPPDVALAGLAAVIDHLDMNSDTYEADLASLMGAGATIWTLSGPGSGQEPEQGHPLVRP